MREYEHSKEIDLLARNLQIKNSQLIVALHKLVDLGEKLSSE